MTKRSQHPRHQRRSRIWRVMLSVGLLACARPAHAQEPAAPEPTPHPIGQWRIGMVAVTPNVKLLDLGIDTNVFNYSGTERRPADFTSTVQPEVEVRLTTRRFDVRAIQKMGMVYYHRYASERALNPGSEFSFEHRLNSRLLLYGRGAGGFSKVRNDFEVDARVRRLSHDGVAGARLVGRKVEFEAQASYTDIAYERGARFLDIELSQTLDHAARGGGVSVGYRLSPFTAIAMTSNLTTRRFRFAPERNTESVSATVGLRFSPRAVIGGDLAVGYRTVNPQSAGTPRFSGLVPRVGVSYKFRDTLALGVGAQRDVEHSFYADRPYFVYTLLEGSVRQVILHRFDVGGTAQYTTLDYRHFAGAGGPGERGVRDKMRLIAGNVGFPLGRQIRVSWYVQQWERRSADLPYRTVRTGLEVGVGRINLSPRGVFLHGPGR